MNIENDIDFILSHFENSLFPRTMMTKRYNYQFLVNSREEIIQKCLESDLIDCRVNAYPSFVKWEKYNLIRYPPNFIFIDLDLGNFAMDRKKLDLVLRKTLKKIEEYQGIPTVLWTGNGYHIYLPINAIVLDQEKMFSKGRFPSLFSISGKYNNCSVCETFLRYAEIFLTNGKADPQHHPKYKTCLIRIPNTLNSKCLAKGLSLEKSGVKVIQQWDGYQPPIQLLTKEFRRWLYQEEINQNIRNRKIRNTYSPRFNETNNFQIQWIERLLQTGIPDGRKETLRLILGPYVAKRNTYEKSLSKLLNWIEKCEKVKPLDRGFYPKQRIENSLKNIRGFLILNNLRIKYPWLYNVIQSRINIDTV